MTPATADRSDPWSSFRPWLTAVRLLGLHLVSRQTPRAVAALIGCALFLRLAAHAHWIQGSGPLAQQVPLLIEGAAAAIVAVATYNPFGESEVGAGRRLPGLRLVAALATTGAAFGLLAAGAACAFLPGGDWTLLRGVAGLTGLGLLWAVLRGGALAWVAPLAYTAIGEFNLTTTWRSPWRWSACPPHDLKAALCAGAVFVLGAALLTGRETHDTRPS